MGFEARVRALMAGKPIVRAMEDSDLARFANIKTPTLTKAFKSEGKDVSYKVLEKIAKPLDVSVQFLMTGVGEEVETEQTGGVEKDCLTCGLNNTTSPVCVDCRGFNSWRSIGTGESGDTTE